MTAPPDAIDLARDACGAADEKQATDLRILDVSELLGLVDLFVIAGARTDRQLKAVAESVENQLREIHGRRPLRREGTPESGWMLLDYGDVVCHLFDEEQRGFYLLERLWADVPSIDPVTGEVVPGETDQPRDDDVAVR